MAEVTCGFMTFDGTDDEIAVADNAAYDVTAAMSFHLWFIRDWEDSSPVLIKRASTVTVEITADNRLKVTVSGVTAVTFTKGLAKQEWHAVGLALYESGTSVNFELYYRGVLYEVQSVADAAMPAAAATAYYIGSAGSASFFKGRMTNFVSTSDRLTAAEMKTIYDSGMLVQDVADYDADMICFPFNDGSGTTLDNDGLAGVDGTAAGTPVWAAGAGIHLGENPIKIEDQSDRYYGPLAVKQIEWVNATTAGQKAQVTDWSGNNVFQVTCAVDKDGGGQKEIGMWVEGLKVPDLDSGFLLLTLE